MRKMTLVLSFSAFVVGGVFACRCEGHSLFNRDNVFMTGCNYWASHAGMYMWRRWNADVVEKDIAELARNGVNIMRVFPLWPDFQPICRLLGGHMMDKGVCQGGGPLANEAGVDEEMMRRFRFLCDVSEKNGVKLVVGLITGWMSGRMFVPSALESKNPIADAEAIKWEVRFVRHFVREMRDHPAIIGWDLGNECNVMAGAPGCNDAVGVADCNQAWVWMNSITLAIRAEDDTRPVVSGMHGGYNCRGQRFNLYDQGELLDELSTHPYPLFTPYCDLDPFNGIRSETHPVAESLFYWGLSGKHCFVEEVGDLGRGTCSPERSAANARCGMVTAWANGLGAYVWWCAFDQEHLGFPPYSWNAVERELGLFSRNYEPKPTLREMDAFHKFLSSLPADVACLAPRRIDATVLVSDREKAWPSAFGAYLLSRQAGFDIRFASAERFPLPETPIYILPSGAGCEQWEYDPYSQQAWDAVLEKAKSGATILISKGNDTRYSGLLRATGNQIEYFRRVPREFSFTLKGREGLEIIAHDETTTEIKPKGSEVLGITAEGRVVVTTYGYGKGKVVFCNFPIESDSLLRTDCFEGERPNPRYLVYREVAEIAGLDRRVLKVDAPGVGLTEHVQPSGTTIVVAVNYDNRPVRAAVRINGTIGKVFAGIVKRDYIDLPANDYAVFEVKSVLAPQ